MKEKILEKHKSLNQFAKKIGVKPQLLNYYIKRGDKLNPLILQHLNKNI